MSGAVEGVDRDALNHHEQMLDAQAGCVPCKLCGGSAVINDAGSGAGYHIKCGNSTNFRQSRGCMIDERSCGGWAYNVMDWWNRLHAATAPPARSYADGLAVAAKHLDERAERARVAAIGGGMDPLDAELLDYEYSNAAAAIRLLSQGEKA